MAVEGCAVVEVGVVVDGQGEEEVSRCEETVVAGGMTAEARCWWSLARFNSTRDSIWLLTSSWSTKSASHTADSPPTVGDSGGG